MEGIYNYFAGPAIRKEEPASTHAPASVSSSSIASTSQVNTSPSSLNGRTYIITGAASGIGRAAALHLASKGANLALTDADGEGGRTTCQEVGALGLKIDIVFATLDVTDHDAVVKLVKNFYRTFKRIHGLVNCAGVNIPSSLSHETPPVLLSTMVDVNAKGVYSFSQAFVAPIMLNGEEWHSPEGGYSIVNLGSTGSLRGVPGGSAYAASQHALLGLSRSMSLEYALYNIRVNLLALGPISTSALHDYVSAEEVAITEAELIQTVPMRRLGQTKEVAHAIAFLLGVESSYITGASIPVDGGLSA